MSIWRRGASLEKIGASAEVRNRPELLERKRHIAFLDGLRGVAVLLVLVYHHGLLNFGWVGVDLFFVLSGYLITGILRSSRGEGTYWRTFWIKRVTRILPPLLMVVAAALLLGFAMPWWQTLLYLLSFGDVVAYIRPTFEALRPLWSLAVEEHFYLLWPFAVRSLPRRALIWILGALVVVEPLSRCIASLYTHDWQVVYFLTPFRLDGLAFGSMLALLMESPQSTRALTRWSGWGMLFAVGAWAGLRVGLGGRFTRDNPTWMYNGGCYWLVALAAGCLIAYLLTHPRAVVSRSLSWRVIVFVGQISYGLYLYQVLVKEVVQRSLHIGVHGAIWIDVPITVLLAWLSFRYVERPLIAWGRRRAASYLVTAAAAAGGA